jgi:Na+-transporting methylmalonyl-CoA/oxaloacetate decarboxylase gamma subunit
MSNMVIALEITALGMGLVFAAIILLWWMMDLLTRITADKEQPSGAESVLDASQTAPIMDRDIRAKAVSVAVAIALAEQKVCLAYSVPEPPTAIVSAWQLGMRTRHLYQKGTQSTHKPRKQDDI